MNRTRMIAALGAYVVVAVFGWCLIAVLIAAWFENLP